MALLSSPFTPYTLHLRIGFRRERVKGEKKEPGVKELGSSHLLSTRHVPSPHDLPLLLQSHRPCGTPAPPVDLRRRGGGLMAGYVSLCLGSLHTINPPPGPGSRDRHEEGEEGTKEPRIMWLSLFFQILTSLVEATWWAVPYSHSLRVTERP